MSDYNFTKELPGTCGPVEFSMIRTHESLWNVDLADAFCREIGERSNVYAYPLNVDVQDVVETLWESEKYSFNEMQFFLDNTFVHLGKGYVCMGELFNFLTPSQRRYFEL